MLTTIHCPHCNSEDCRISKIYNTSSNGSRNLYECNNCRNVFSETKGTFMENIRKPISLIAKVLQARSEGIAFNAACRLFEIAKNTLLDWERRFSDLKEILMIYALVHQFISQVVEGDELYTKVNKNVPADESEGWTILLMERASRFIWALGCGKKDRTLFFYAVQILRNVINQTQDLTLITDGERRYGNLLFEICCEVFHSGLRGRPPKVLREGIKIRIKNKGKQDRKRGRKRPKYETPHAEHPRTRQNIGNTEIHANHAEAFNSSLRRRCSAYRRRTNTYAKNKTALQRVLDGVWIVHNFIREHFTTRQVPAVALGIIEKGFSWEQILMIQKTI